ncbi:MAG: endolytic transglycosylase MltG [Candidatus Margulisbacteria bacterium]|nr:endolytic transglycosylase MltG [Candidatus Margulisiibacteriota bacterium]
MASKTYTKRIYQPSAYKTPIIVRIDNGVPWLALPSIEELYKKKQKTLITLIEALAFDTKTHRKSGVLTTRKGKKKRIHYYHIDVVIQIGTVLKSPYLAPFQEWLNPKKLPVLPKKTPLKTHIHFLFIPFLLIAFVIYQLVMPLSLTNNPITIIIPHNSTTRNALSILQKNHLIRNPFLIRAYLKVTRNKHVIQFGKFQLNRNTMPLKIIRYVQDNQGEHALIRVTLPEGFSIQQIAQTLEKTGVIKANKFILYTQTKAKQELAKAYPFLNDYPNDTIEGYLYPNTYFFTYNTPAKIIVATMLREFQHNMIPVWENRIKSGHPKLSFHQNLTLASILEKEAVVQSELPIIASVYQNRITKRMRLEADPTVVYALGKSHKKRVLYKDLRIDSPYNTYKFFGLPPSPIASPSKRAFEAAVNPAKTDYLYFVANPLTHQHLFGRSYREHCANIRRVR